MRNSSLWSAVNLTLAFLAFGFSAVGAAEAPDFKIKSVSLAGSACQANADTKVEVKDGKIVIPYPVVEAKMSNKVSLRDSRRNCGAVIDLTFSGKFQGRVKSVKTKVYSVGAAAIGVVRADARYQAESTATFQDSEMKGDIPAKEVVLDLGGSPWSPCGSMKPVVLQMQSKLLKAPEGPEEVKVGFEGPVIVEFEWRTCKG